MNSQSLKQFICLVYLAVFSASCLADQKKEYLIQRYIGEWLDHSVVIESIKSANVTHKNITQNEIDRLDKQWRQEVEEGSGDLVQSLLNNELSLYLDKVMASMDNVTEIFVVDNKGLNVGQSVLTSDYWQGDEDKFIKTFLVGANAVYLSEVEFDESTQTYQAQLSKTIVDENNNAIGAVTMGVIID